MIGPRIGRKGFLGAEKIIIRNKLSMAAKMTKGSIRMGFALKSFRELEYMFIMEGL